MQIKRLVQLSTTFSWINLLIGIILVFFALMSGLLFVGVASVIMPVVMWGSVILHSYAAIQLQKSIVGGVPLSNQTGVGIRFIGFIALFIGIICLASGIILIRNSKELAQQITEQIQLPPEAKNWDMSKFARGIGIFFLLISITLIGNVLINLRLFRWYQQSRQEQEEFKDNN